MGGRLRPDDEHVGERGIGNPGLAPGEAIAVGDLLGPRLHAGGVGAGVGLGEPEAADQLSGRELGQILLALGLVAIDV
jgi:hypothetical protein